MLVIIHLLEFKILNLIILANQFGERRLSAEFIINSDLIWSYIKLFMFNASVFKRILFSTISYNSAYPLFLSVSLSEILAGLLIGYTLPEVKSSYLGYK
jgi:hypothetical protein